MSEQPPITSSKPGDSDHAAETPPDLSKISASNTDDSPTVISRMPPTQAFARLANQIVTAGAQVRGRKLAHFELLEPIGVGGMAAVLRARDVLLDRFVALKILPPDMACDGEHVKRFHQEARAAAKLDHENVARVYYCGEDQDLHFIAFEFVEGQNLRTILERSGRIPAKDAVHYLLQISAGLAHAAGRGVVHRDIKPSNIIVTASGRAKLVDMGLARSLGPQDQRQLTQSGVTLGTFDYISPEQALEPREADVRSDIYSLGCTFYHMLTGQPPVPDGTAAKKLHHHQHVPPIDPRQLNPEIPNEIAAILQRMMAKNPKDRYQRAEHLVQHLLGVAQQLGGIDVPQAALFVDALLPEPPRQRPLALFAGAAVLLAFVVFAMAVTTPATKPLLPFRYKSAFVPDKDEKSAKGLGPAPTKDLPAETRGVGDEFEWAAALAEDRPLKIILHDDLNLGEADSVYRGGNSGRRFLVVESADAANPATIQFNFAPDTESATPFWAGLLIEGGNVTFRNIHFVVEASHTPRRLAAGVMVKAGQVLFDRCQFSQLTPDEPLIGRKNAWPIASVAAWGLSLERPVVFRHCYFVGGQAAISVKGSAAIEHRQCAFDPHVCLFHLWGQDKTDKAEIRLENISCHVAYGPVFRLDESTSCHLAVKNCIFSGPPHAGSLDRPDFIRQTGATRAVVYEGKHNAYYQLASFWAKSGNKDALEVADWTAFQKRIVAAGGKDEGSFQLKTTPWAKPSPESPDDARSTFLVDSSLAELRQEGDKKRPIGVEDCATWGMLYRPGELPALPSAPIDTPPKLGLKERLVDPSGVTAGPRAYKKIEAAISEAEPDDVVVIKWTGEIRMEPIALTENRHVKVRAFPGHQPILTLGKTAEKSPALFHLQQSQIDFENVEFLLRPDASQRNLAIVAIEGESSCRFDHCAITLDRADGFVGELEVVSLLDAVNLRSPTAPNRAKFQPALADRFDLVALSGGAAPIPVFQRPAGRRTEVKFKGCFVRGGGDLVGVTATRPFDVHVDGSLLSLAGSMLAVRPNGGEAAADSAINVRIGKSTFFLTEPALHLAWPRRGKNLVFTQVQAANCLFAAAAGKPLVRVTGPENDGQLKKTLAWTSAANAFLGYEKLLELGSADGPTILAFSAEEWKKFSGSGPDSRFDRAAWQPAALAERALAQLMPADFAPKSDLANYGVQPDTLPRPSVEAGGPWPAEWSARVGPSAFAPRCFLLQRGSGIHLTIASGMRQCGRVVLSAFASCKACIRPRIETHASSKVREE